MASYYTELDDDLWQLEEGERAAQEWEKNMVCREVKDRRPDYQAARQAKTGETVKCAGCGRKFKKRSYQQAFCSNKGKGNCKDRYWNVVNPRGEKAGQI